MKITNKNDFPEWVVKYLLTDDYDYEPGVVSATGLMKPVRARILQERHNDATEMDVIDMFARRFGTAVHDSFEAVDYDPAKIRQEERHYTEVAGQKISGKFDILERVGDEDSSLFQLKDIKTTSVWKYVHMTDEDDRTLTDWRIQLSIYRLILERNDIQTMDTAEVLMVMKDWKQGEATKDAEKGGRYPKAPLFLKKIDLMSLEATQLWIASRLNALTASRKLDDDDLPRCRDEELWKNPDKYAHWNKGNAKASKIYDTEAEARDAVSAAIEKGKDAYIESRPGDVKRCLLYCPAHEFCNQYHDLKENGHINGA